MIVGIIPARGGSKGVPRKNLKELNGKPLIYWSVLRAQQSKLLDKVYVSTEDSEIADYVKSLGCQVLCRPNRLATDRAKTIDVLHYHWEELNKPKEVVTLQPTSPMRLGNLIDNCISEFSSSNTDILATGFISKQKEFGSHNNLRRQDIEGFFYDDGNLYIHSSEALKNKIWGSLDCQKYMTSETEHFEIDTEVDFLVLESLIKNYFESEEKVGL